MKRSHTPHFILNQLQRRLGPYLGVIAWSILGKRVSLCVLVLLGFFCLFFFVVVGGLFLGEGGGGFGSFVEIGLMIVEKIDRTFNCKNVLNVNKNLY